MKNNYTGLELADRFESFFLEEIEKKNSWGKNEIKALHKDCMIKALYHVMNDMFKDLQ